MMRSSGGASGQLAKTPPIITPLALPILVEEQEIEYFVATADSPISPKKKLSSAAAAAPLARLGESPTQSPRVQVPSEKNIRIVAVGDGSCGAKTCLLKVLYRNRPRNGHIPSFIRIFSLLICSLFHPSFFFWLRRTRMDRGRTKCLRACRLYKIHTRARLSTKTQQLRLYLRTPQVSLSPPARGKIFVLYFTDHSYRISHFTFKFRSRRVRIATNTSVRVCWSYFVGLLSCQHPIFWKRCWKGTWLLSRREEVGVENTAISTEKNG